MLLTVNIVSHNPAQSSSDNIPSWSLNLQTLTKTRMLASGGEGGFYLLVGVHGVMVQLCKCMLQESCNMIDVIVFTSILYIVYSDLLESSSNNWLQCIVSFRTAVD